MKNYGIVINDLSLFGDALRNMNIFEPIIITSILGNIDIF